MSRAHSNQSSPFFRYSRHSSSNPFLALLPVLAVRRKLDELGTKGIGGCVAADCRAGSSLASIFLNSVVGNLLTGSPHEVFPIEQLRKRLLEVPLAFLEF